VNLSGAKHWYTRPHQVDITSFHGPACTVPPTDCTVCPPTIMLEPDVGTLVADGTCTINSLHILGRRASGALWDAYAVRPSPTSTLALPDTTLIAKITNVEAFPSDSEEAQELGSYTRSEARHAILNETRLFSGPLKFLQGKVVPRFYGMFRSIRSREGQVWCGVYDDAGIALSDVNLMNPVIQ